MKHKSIFSTIVAAAIGALVFTAAPTVAGADPITTAIAGKSITSAGAVIKLRKNGKLSGTMKNGTKLAGAWTVRDGKFCRTLTAPEAAAGTACQQAVLGNGTITITGKQGPIVWEIK